MADGPYVELKGERFSVELAQTQQKQALGLMFRESMPQDHGMLFLFPNIGKRTFWMKNTHIPLSIAFVDDAGSIVMIHQMEADQTRVTYHSFHAVRYALEVNRGWFARHGIKRGDRVDMTLPTVLNIR